MTTYISTYIISSIDRVPYSISLIKQLVSRFPNIVVGMKDSSGDVVSMKQICAELPGFQLYAGTEKYMLDVLNAGGVGCISATANATSALVAKVYEAWKEEKEELVQLQKELVAARTAFEGFVFVAALKSYFAHKQGKDSWLNVRPPNTVLSQKQLAQLLDRLA